MIISHLKDVAPLEMKGPGVVNAFKQAIIGPNEGWEGYVMRIMTLKEKGSSPRHTHPWPHINYIVSGTGTIFLNGQDNPIQPGSFAYIPAEAEHQFRSDSDEDLVFICIVPEEGDK